MFKIKCPENGPLVPESLHGYGGQRDGRTDRYDEANIRFSQCRRNAYRGSGYIVTKRKLLTDAHWSSQRETSPRQFRARLLLDMNVDSHILISNYHIYSAFL